MKQIELQNLSKIVNCTCEHEHEDSHLEKSIKAEGGLYHWNKDKQPIEDIYEKLIDFNQLYEYLLSKIEYKKSIVKAFVFGKPKLLLKTDGNPFTNEELS